ncbi:acyltransferase family protein [Bradyrhizobium sp. WD16]|uniref:acyltransferase family protein n=1 Tax=Bradyrhizobium sp. WD16 TaxID=1521768 RepID=UPI0020A37256|nr:acyltransferase family protein [Bradyrhizobium sp. WD16]UTD28543.1 acyltransferase [Bradyrhizobium sp. WD16]
MSDRYAALDRARTFVTLLVLANHTVVAYTAFGRFYPNHYLWSTAPIVDVQKWIGFNLFTLFNDAFFMALMYLLSGLFVWPSLMRKGIAQFLRDRALRLGIPYVVAVIFLMPIAYYASFSLTGKATGFLPFWLDNFRNGVWFNGPAWFIWLLLLLDGIAALLFLIAPSTIIAIGRLSTLARDRAVVFGLALFIVATLAYMPMLFKFGAVRWFNLGPFEVQASRLLLYAVFFFAGVGIGAADLAKGLLARDGQLACRWFAATMVAAIAFGLLSYLINFRRMRLSNLVGAPPLWWQSSYGVIYAATCVAISLAILALFLRFSSDGESWLDALQADAYGIYVVHYLFCLWLQYALLGFAISAAVKVLIVFSGTLALSWGMTAALRSLPAVRRVL